MSDAAVLRNAFGDRRLDDAWAEYLRLKAAGNAGPEAHFYGALTARLQGDLFAARSALEQGMDSEPSGAMLGQIRMTLGVVLLEIGDIRAALTETQAFIDGMDSYPELAPLALGAAYFNLGLALRQAKQLSEAMEAYKVAIAECRREGLREYERMALQNLAWAACVGGKPGQAAEALDEAEDLCESEEARWQQRIGRALLETVAGEHHRAIEICEAIARGPSSVPPDVRSHAYWLAGRVAREMGRFMEAEALAHQALNSALEARGENRCLQDASELLQAVRNERIRRAGP